MRGGATYKNYNLNNETGIYTYKVRFNRESGYGRCDVIIEPFDKTKKAFIFEFEALDSDGDEETLEEILKNAHA